MRDDASHLIRFTRDALLFQFTQILPCVSKQCQDCFTAAMAIDTTQLEAAIRNAIPVAHLEIEDQSSGCGESYAIILVSPVRLFLSSLISPCCACSLISVRTSQAFEGKNTLARHRMGTVSRALRIRILAHGCFPVNEMLKNEIAQMHAFSQVCPYFP